MSLKIKTLTLTGAEDFSKIICDVLRALGITISNASSNATDIHAANINATDTDAANVDSTDINAAEISATDIDGLEIFNEILGNRVFTRLKVTTAGGEFFFRKSSFIRGEERRGAEINRLVKRNVYLLLTDAFALDAVPYGILHGVRPTKIIQRLIGDGFGVTSHGVIDRDKISRRICADFLTTREKANLLTEVAVSQLPTINATDARTVGVYVGIPFCRTRCLYCSFPSNVLPDEKEIAEFMRALTRDIEAAAEDIRRYGLTVQTIYIGGGTPTALPEKFFAELLETVHKNFCDSSVEEFTVECGRPDTITAAQIATLKKFPVTRVSVNPQTMHQRTLDIIGRRHTVEDVTRAFRDLRTAGDWLINMDLIAGLPGETLADFKETLRQILELNPDNVTIHTLAIKRGSRLQMRLADELNTREDFNLPSDAEVRKMAEYASDVLRKAKFLPYYLYRQGYMSGQIENVGWCRRGAEGIYNIQIMGEQQTILGVGAAASTKVPDPNAKKILTAFNAKDLPTYLRELERYIARREEILEQVYSPVEVADAAEISSVAEVADTSPDAEVVDTADTDASPFAEFAEFAEVADAAEISTDELAEVAGISSVAEVADTVEISTYTDDADFAEEFAAREILSAEETISAKVEPRASSTFAQEEELTNGIRDEG